PRRQRLEQVVVVAVTTTGLVADLEAIGQALEDAQHLLQPADLAALDKLPLLAEHAQRDALRLNVDTHVNQKARLDIEERQGSRTCFHVTRLTEASFIVSHRLQWLPQALSRPDQVQCCYILLVSKRMSLSARERVQGAVRPGHCRDKATSTLR